MEQGPLLNQERRATDRFPIEREMKYRVLAQRNGDGAGEGRTINMSSGGILFSASEELITGRRVEVAVNWPAQLNSTVALRLVARGRIVRSQDRMAAMEIQQYEFRTAPRQG